MDANPNTAATTAHDRHAAEAAAHQLHKAELALRDAHQTCVDAWITAAADRLNAAVVRYTDAISTVAGHRVAGTRTAA